MTDASPDAEVLVVGAGIAGLMAAATLAGAGRSVIVVDKGRGVGGRMATRRIGDAVFDHGAQFFTTPGEELTSLAEQWRDAGVVVPWFDGRLCPDGSMDPDGHVRWRGASGMTAVAKHLARDLDVRTGCRLTSLTATGRGWRAEVADGEDIRADALVLTAPVPQSLALLDAGGVALSTVDDAELRAVEYHPCLAVLAVLDGPAGLPAPGAWRLDTEPVEFVADNQAKAISPAPALTVHAGPRTSREWWDRVDADVAAGLLAAVPGLAAAPVDGAVQVQRWRFARPVQCRPEPARLLADLPPAVVAGDVFAGPLVGGAARSGLAAARLLHSLWADSRSA